MIKGEHIADGAHSQLRWYVQQFSGDTHRFVTVSGHIGAQYVYHAELMPDATPASVRRWCEALAAEPVAKRERR